MAFEYLWEPEKLYMWCDVIKQNELQPANTDFKTAKQTMQIISLFPIAFACIFGTHWPISMGSVVKGSFANHV